MIIVAGTFKFKADKVKEATVSLIATQTISNTEEGCRAYRFSQSLEEETVFYLYEEWESQAALDAHAANPKLKELGKERKNYMDGNADVKFYHLDE